MQKGLAAWGEPRVTPYPRWWPPLASPLVIYRPRAFTLSEGRTKLFHRCFAPTGCPEVYLSHLTMVSYDILRCSDGHGANDEGVEVPTSSLLHCSERNLPRQLRTLVPYAHATSRATVPAQPNRSKVTSTSLTSWQHAHGTTPRSTMTPYATKDNSRSTRNSSRLVKADYNHRTLSFNLAHSPPVL